MPRRLSLLLGAALAATPTLAAAQTYDATLATPVTGAAVVRDLRWHCTEGACVAPLAATSTDATVCAAVVRRFGPVTAFTAGPRAFSAEAIDRCNAAKR